MRDPVLRRIGRGQQGNFLEQAAQVDFFQMQFAGTCMKSTRICTTRSRRWISLPIISM